MTGVISVIVKKCLNCQVHRVYLSEAWVGQLNISTTSHDQTDMNQTK